MGTSSDHKGGSGGAWSRAQSIAGDWSGKGGGGAGDGVAGVVAAAAGALAAAAGGASALALQQAAAATARLAGLASVAATDGVPEALRRYGLDSLIGKPSFDVQEGLIEFLAGSDPISREDDAIRHAAEEAANAFTEQAEDLEQIVVDEERALRLLETFLAAWLTRMINVQLGTALTEASPAQAEARSREIRDYVGVRLDQLLAGRPLLTVDWNNAEGRQLAAQAIQDALEVFRADK